VTSDFAQANALRLCAAGRVPPWITGERLGAVMADPGDQNAAEVRLNRLLNLILETAVEVLGFDGATVTARHEKELATVGATD